MARWPSSTAPMVEELTAPARSAGHSSVQDRSRWLPELAGTAMSRTSSVMAMATTQSLNASRQSVPNRDGGASDPLAKS